MAVHYFDPNGVDSLRNNGYRDTAMALSELIDNSIQAEATKIEIGLIARLSNSNTRREWLVNEIYISDNGVGMDKETVETSLRFGGGTRHGASKGLGKFGMGLPNSSASQCSRFEVFSWKNPSNILFNYFDFNEIKEQRSEYLPEVIKKELPNHISKLNSLKSTSGSIIRWVNCDRLILRRASKLVPHICFPLGKIFRYFIADNKIEIKIRVFEDNGQGGYSEKTDLTTIVKAVDPLFLMTNTQLPEPFNSKATNILWQDGEYLFPDPNGDKDNRELFAKIKNSIKIKCSISKVETKRLGGSSKLGDIYRQLIGISIIRAGREIKLDDFGFLGELGDPLNRWWKIELSFEPNFDTYFGLDNTKQNVHAFKKVANKDELAGYEDELQLDFICKLSEFLESQIKKMRKDIDLIDAGARGGGKLLPTNIGEDSPVAGDVENPFPTGTFPVPLPGVENVNDDQETDEEKEELKSWLLLRYPEYAENEVKLKLAIDWFFKTEYNQVIVFSQLGAASFYEFQAIGHKVIIEINTEHEFYLEFIRPIFEENDLNKIEQLLILFGSMVEAEKELVSYSQYITKFRSLFAVKLSQFIFDWKESK
jgi:hypothetical protein